MEESYTLGWVEADEVVEEEEVICSIETDGMIIDSEDIHEVCDDIGEEVVVHTEEVPEDGVVYLTEDVIVMHNPQGVAHEIQDNAYMDCVTEEVIADNWEEESGNDLTVGSEEHIGIVEEVVDDVMIPLPTDQDQYSAMRPYPCDFCSRRFRKKANLMNHMIAHQTDKPHVCNLCGVRYVRKFDLMNHLKVHAYVPETDNLEEDALEDENERGRKRQRPAIFVKKRKPKVKLEEDYAACSSQEYSENDSGFPAVDPTQKPFVCQHCGVGFGREKALESHAKMHQGDSPFECRHCDELFWDINALREHAKEKHDGLEDDYDDDDDDEDFEDEEIKCEHFCHTCGMTFARMDQLKRHQRVHIKNEYVANENDYAHVCNVCGESFGEALDLLAHAEVHARSSEFRCMMCGDTTSDEQSLAAHVQAKHGDNLPENTCLHCGRTCKDRRTLLAHCMEHSKEKTFPCPKCAKTFHNKARLKRHMLSHRNKAVTCDVCGEDFPDGRSLMNHRHSHNSVSGRQFPCRECGKTFGSRSSQQIHIRIHTGERPYGCRFCWKAFADGGTLRKHERIHTGEKPYACAVCPRAFNQRVVLREHIRSHHSGPDPNYKHSMTPFCCAVCSDMFTTSQDLIVHLIHHCDLNTAMRRQPQVGPRKYKRRRKLKPHELELMGESTGNYTQAAGEDEDAENVNNEFFDTDEDVKPLVRRRQKPPATPSASTKSPDNSYAEMYNNLSSAIENINTMGANKAGKAKKKKDSAAASTVTTSARPKMIHTQKTKVAVETNEGGRMKHKTKTMITRTQPADDYFNDRVRPRTKNVSYHIIAPDKLPLATFHDATEQAVNSLLELNPNTDHEEIINGAEMMETFESAPPIKRRGRRSSSNDASTSGNCLGPGRHIIDGGQVVKFVGSGMLVKKIKMERVEPEQEEYEHDENVPEAVVETEVSEPDFITIKQEVVENPLNDLADISMQHAQNIFKCEMCSSTFADRGKLMLHVSVHI